MLPYSRAMLAVSRTASHCTGQCAPLIRTALRSGLLQSRRTVTNFAPNTKIPSQSDSAGAQHAKNETPSVSDQVRLLMRRVPYPVAIITATDPHGPADKAFRGMTVSSFNTVTLSPEPVISFNVRRPSETLSALQSSKRFLIHLLAPRQATATLARDFSRGNHNLSLLAGKSDYEFVSHDHSIRGDETPTRPLPLLQRKQGSGSADSEDFPFVLECQLHPQGIQVHDHTIVVGTVVRALSGQLPSLDSETKAADLCLTYANTHFWEMGHEI
ncbi:oxidoreductase [Aspergillus sclerotioniger CBS 115572]|uniref:Oxidoreductase n=1 Tax=Aspergillus sclerotioniger CBS 115572 TaxID=1450535 RepID=A0A317XET8_9EURO|nr:oxidoreductase [Aspergillus sclerotioniger CBS 115572]PWY95140.1 oxidoreductase [Aspergillus sclerotioniger CBS 115572]